MTDERDTPPPPWARGKSDDAAPRAPRGGARTASPSAPRPGGRAPVDGSTPGPRQRFRATGTSPILTGEATPAWRRALRIVIPAAALLVAATAWDLWTTHAAIQGYLDYEAIMGFDAHLLEGIEDLERSEGLTLGADGVHGWIMGASNTWLITTNVRCKACFVVPYELTFSFRDDLPFDGYVQGHLDNFYRAGWYLDDAIIEQFRLQTKEPTLEALVREMHRAVYPPP